MKTKFIVLSNGISKKSSKPYSRCVEVAKTKNGDGEYLQEKNVRFLDKILPVGTILETSDSPLVEVDKEDIEY